MSGAAKQWEVPRMATLRCEGVQYFSTTITRVSRKVVELQRVPTSAFQRGHWRQSMSLLSSIWKQSAKQISCVRHYFCFFSFDIPSLMTQQSISDKFRQSPPSELARV